MELERLLGAKVRMPTSQTPSDKGEDAEELILGVLNNHLPGVARAYRGGAILDCRERISNQVDIVVYSNWSPLLHQNKKPIFFAEGTYAAIEVKSTLTKDALVNFLNTYSRLKTFRKFLIPETKPAISLSPASNWICTGIFAYSSRIKNPKTIHSILMDYHSSGIPNTEMPDFVCVNGKFCFQRMRTEDTSGFTTFKAEEDKRTLGDIQKECRYFCFEDSLAMMFDAILNYVCYSGPIRHFFGTYIHTTG